MTGKRPWEETTSGYEPPQPFAPPGSSTQPMPGPVTGPPAVYPPPPPPVPYPHQSPGVDAYGRPLPSYYSYPGPPPGSDRPGSVIATSTLGFVQSGVLLIAAIWLFIASFFVDAVGTLNAESTDPSAYDFDGLSTWLLVNAALNVAAVALLIAGGIMVLNRHRAGAWLYLAGLTVNVATFITWLVLHTASLWFTELLFVLLPLIGAGLLFGRPWAWLGGLSADAAAA